MANNIEVFYEAALKYTRLAGSLIRERIFTEKTVSIKSTEIDLVTETDQEVEKLLIENLSKQFPDHKFIGEESVADGSKCVLTDAPTWIIDPIDGTTNFVHQFPHSCISIALLIEKKPEIAIIYNPIIKQLFWAKRGQGAYLNGERIKVSGETVLKKALVIMEFGSSRDPEKLKIFTENQKILLPQIHGIRGLGAAALDLSMVALGGADVFVDMGSHVWDYAAGQLLVEEAGGVVLDPTGGPFDGFSRRVLAASSEELAKQIAERVIQFYPTPRD